MMDSGHYFTVGNMAWNAGLIAALGYFIKRWMDDTRGKIDKHCDTNKKEHNKFETENREAHKHLFGKWEDHESRIVRVETTLELEGK